MENIEKVKLLIQQKFKSSKGKCGLYLVTLQNEVYISEEELKNILRKLYDEKFFIIREGLNGKMLTIKN